MKNKFVLATSLLLSGLILTSCNKNNNTDVVEPIKHYLVSFYVDNDLYMTAQVEKNKTIDVTIPEPEKDGFIFKGWKDDSENDFDLNSTITSSINLYAYFEIDGNTISDPHEGENSLNVTDIKDSSKKYSLVIGWYGKSETSGINKELMQHIYKNIISYLKFNNVDDNDINKISVRQYGDENTKVGPMGELINNDGDVDIVLGVGVNITTTGKVETIKRVDGITFGEKSGRSMALLKDNYIAKDLFDYLSTEDGMKLFIYDNHFINDVSSSYVVSFYVDNKLYLAIEVARNELINKEAINEPIKDTKFLYWASEDGKEFDFTTKINKNFNLYAVFESVNDPHEGENLLNVTDIKDVNKTYSLVIGWYGNTSTSGIDEKVMQHIYKNILTYFESINTSSDILNNISVRKYGEEGTNITDTGKLVNEDGQVDIFMGAGKNMTSKGQIQTVVDNGTTFRTDGITINNVTNRSIGLLKDTTIGRELYTFITSEDGKKIFDYNYHYSK